MRTFTKSLLTFLLLLVVGSLSAQSLILLDPNGERDWSKQADGEYPYYFDNGWLPEGASKDVINGALHIENTTATEQNYQLQLFILDWFNTTEGEDYVIRIWMKASGEGTADLNIGTWGANATSSFKFEASEDYKMYSIDHTAGVTSTGNNEHIMFQCGTFVGTIDIQKVQILQKGEEKPVLSTKFGISSWIKNGDAEGDDLSSFPVSLDGPNNGDSAPDSPKIVEGEGVDGSKCFKVTAFSNPTETWHSQFYLLADEVKAKGTEWALKMSIKADIETKISTSGQGAPRQWKGGMGIDDFNVTNEWQEYNWTGSISFDDFQSVAFDLSNENGTPGNADISFYFDNIQFGQKVPEFDAQFKADGIQVLFPYYTNIIRLMKQYAKGKTRYILPTSCVKVTVDDEVVDLESVEADITGTLMIFLKEQFDEDAKVVVNFTNPEDTAYRLFLLDSDNAVENFEVTATYNDELIIVADKFNKVSLMSSDPEDGSFNLPGTINSFKLTFDKEVKCEDLVAKIGNEVLTVEPATGYAVEVTMKRTGTDPLADGDYVLTVTNIKGKATLEISSCEISFSVGAKVSEELTTAINDASNVLEENTDENNRYAGEAYTALSEAITKYTTEAPTYTAPSVIDAAILDLSDKVKAMNAHHKLVDQYDEANSKIQELAGNLAESKFNTTELYLQLKALAEKYADKLLTIDEQLTAAIEEITPMASLCGDMFTTGESRLGDAGYKVLTERLRLGSETLKALGDETNPLIAEADKAISDDDEIAGKMQYAILEKIYTQLANPDPENPLFKEIDEDEEGLPVYNTFDMSVFAKNPNIYAHQQSKGFEEGNVPGWTASGSGNLYANTTWAGERNIEGLPEDCAFTTWYGNVRMENSTITNLPAGEYNILFYVCDWLNRANADDPVVVQGYVFAKTSETVAAEEAAKAEGEEYDEEFDAKELIIGGEGFNQIIELKHLTVTDGKLTIGAQFAGDSQYFFHKIKLLLAGPAEGFDYAKALNDVKTNIDATKSAKVRAIQLFDLNGRSINKSQKGITIVKKVMSDGTIKTEKVVK